MNIMGIAPVEETVRAVKEAPAPTSVTELTAFLDLINYYHRYIPNASKILEPMPK